MVKKVTKQEFEANKSGLALVDFYADWCGPCRMVGPIVEQLSDEIKGVEFYKINVDEENELAGELQIHSIPTIILFQNGQPIDRIVGFAPKQKLEAWIQNHNQK